MDIFLFLSAKIYLLSGFILSRVLQQVNTHYYDSYR